MAQQGIVTGQSEEIFNPNGNLNRAEAAALLYRILGLEEPTAPEEKPFSDVETEDWYAGYVNDLKDLELINGNPDGTYEPGESINRAEFLQLAMNVYYYLANEETQAEIDALKEGEKTNAYTDLKDDWYTPVITAATTLGFVHGMDCEEEICFNAENKITRAEAIIILYNMFMQ
jgi:hypothetical protein